MSGHARLAQRTVLDDLFEASFDRLFGEGVGLTTQTDAFFESFYGRFLERPEVAALFEAVDLERQSQMLRQSFFKLLTVHLTNDWSKELERVAALHEHLAVDPELYDRWLDDVLETVARTRRRRRCPGVAGLAPGPSAGHHVFSSLAGAGHAGSLTVVAVATPAH